MTVGTSMAPGTFNPNFPNGFDELANEAKQDGAQVLVPGWVRVVATASRAKIAVLTGVLKVACS